MSIKFSLLCVSAIVLLMACGGDDSPTVNTPPPPPPPADTTAPTFTVPADLSVAAGGSLDFDVTAMDSGGFGTTTATCVQGALTTTTNSTDDSQTLSVTFGAPATTGTVDCTATSMDSAGNSADLDFMINVTPVPVNTASFNGTWFGPCYNNGFGFSVRQTIVINGTNLDSDIESFTAGAMPAQNCILPADGILITTDVGASLNYQSDVTIAGCTNNRAVETDVNIQTVDTGGNPTATSEPFISDTLNLVTGFVDILPDSTNICLLANGNLLFADVEYTGAANTTILSPMIDLQSEGAWSLGDNDYAAGTSSSTTDTTTNIGVIVVSTDSDTANGAFSGSTLTLRHTLGGTGVYRVTTADEIIAADPNDTTIRLLDVSTTVGTGVTTGATSYESFENAGFVVAVVDDDGLYHFSTEADITVNRTIDVLGGVDGAPDSFQLEMTNIFDFPE